MKIEVKLPFYAQASLTAIGLFVCFTMLCIGQSIIVPILYATILAILLNPLVNFLIQKKINKIVSIFIAVSLTIFMVFGIFYIISSQVTISSESYPQLKEKLEEAGYKLTEWISNFSNIRFSTVDAWIMETKDRILGDLAIEDSLNQVGQIVVTILLLPVYLFIILYYKPLFLKVIREFFQPEQQKAVSEVLTDSKKVIENYLVGLFFEMVIVAILNSLGLLLLGIKYAILLGIIGALLNLIPYLGGIIGVFIFMGIALVTKSPIYMLYVAMIYSVIQFIDNNFIIPQVVSSRVQINPLISILVVLVGGAMWGLSGMFLSIPLTAIAKVIFDHIDSMKPWGMLLGNVIPTTPKVFFVKLKKVD